MIDLVKKKKLRLMRALAQLKTAAGASLACAVVTVVLALVGARLNGDGGEYLLSAHAFATHGTPAVEVADARWLAHRAPHLQALMRRLEKGMRAGEVAPIGGVRRADSGAYYSIHFWLYSLLAAPALWFTELFGVAPTYALALVNGAAAAAAAAALWAHFARGRYGTVAAVLFLLCGTTFYLGWTGPEVLTGAAVVCSCVLARGGDFALSFLAAALAAAQNASAGALFPYIVVVARPRPRDFSLRNMALTVLAALVAVLPYGFFFAAYRIPSLLAHFATDPKLIGFARAHSLVFDLNQGLVLGVPGLLVGVPLLAALAFRAVARSEWAALSGDIATTLALVTAMAVPTLSAQNWNAGNSVIVRYGYWSALPLLVLCLELAGRLTERSRSPLLGLIVVLELAALVPEGLWGERYSYLRHSWAAKLALKEFPAAYNPVPEIFYERTVGREAPLGNSTTAVWPRHGSPRKLMVRADAAPQDERICRGGETVTSPHVVRTGEWMYLAAPFGCMMRRPVVEGLSE